MRRSQVPTPHTYTPRRTHTPRETHTSVRGPYKRDKREGEKERASCLGEPVAPRDGCQKGREDARAPGIVEVEGLSGWGGKGQKEMEGMGWQRPLCLYLCMCWAGGDSGLGGVPSLSPRLLILLPLCCRLSPSLSFSVLPYLSHTDHLLSPVSGCAFETLMYYLRARTHVRVYTHTHTSTHKHTCPLWKLEGSSGKWERVANSLTGV